MATDYQPLPRYEHCRHSVFISFAHDENAAQNGWVAALRDAMRDRLRLLPGSIPQLEAHFSLDNGPQAGQLAHLLQQRLRQSFCMLLVVGRKYVESGWCEKELEYFVSLFGPQAARSRLLIAAMSEEAIQQARQGPHWRACLPADQVWVPMYSPQRRDVPLRSRLDDGSFAADFFNGVSRLVEPLAEWIEHDYLTPLAPAAAAQAQVASPWSAQSGALLRVGIGPHTADLGAAVAELKPLLERMHAEVTLLDGGLIADYDPDEPEPRIRASLARCDVLVVPASFEKPLQPGHPGGHVDILRSEWARLNKDRGVVWYRPAGVRSPQQAGTLAKHLQVLESLAPVCSTGQAVVNLLFGQKAAEAVTFLVERNQDAPFQRLVRALEKGWSRVPVDPAHPRPELKCELINLENMQAVENRGDAFVLLFPVGAKGLAALGSQQETIRNRFPMKGAIYPGLVAVIRDPPPDHDVHVQSWTSVLFVRRAQELCIEDPSSQVWLDEFLYDVWTQYRDRKLGAAAAALPQ